MIKYSILLFVLCIQCASMKLNAQDIDIPKDYHLVYQEDFESPQSIRDFDMTDDSAWKLGKSKLRNQTLELYGKSNYEARVRSPFNIALIKDLNVSDFILEVELSQSGREYGHRDLCLFFNVMSPTNFYYVHIASVADDNANNIFLVNDEPRTNIATETTSGTDWGETNSWHTARVIRHTESGTIQIYFDGKKIMTANDTHFVDGRIGFGSFDDTGQFDNIKIWAPQLSSKKKGFFH